MNDTETVMFRLALKSALERHFKDSEFDDTTAKGLAQFDRIVGLGRSGAFAFEVLHNCLASEQDTKTAIKSVKDVIQSQLDALNKAHKGVDRNSSTRLKSLIERFNANLDKCSVTINGQDLSRDEINKEKLAIPACLRTERYEATASLPASVANTKLAGKNLELLVSYYR